MRKYLIIFILALAFFLRVIGIAKYPVGFTQDEAGIGYDVYSILKTGKDQWGVTLPLTLRSFGDFKLPLYSYLAIPSVAVFGLNEFAVRFPNALFGTLAVLVTYLMVQELFKKSSFNARLVAILSALLLAISPWHISLSRGAFEANLTTLLIPVGIWAYLLGSKKHWYVILSALAFGLNLFSYYSARMVTPIIIISLLIYKNGTFKFSLNRISSILKENKLFLGLFGIFVLGVIYSMFLGANRRALDVGIFNPTDKWASVANRRLEAIQNGLPEPLARLFSNKYTYVFSNFTRSYLSYFSPNFLFIQGAGEWNYGMIPGRGVLYTIEIVFLFLSLVAIINKKRFRYWQVMVIWILVSPIAASISKSVGFAGNKVAVMIPAIQIFSALGLVVLMRMIKDYFKKDIIQKSLTYLIFIILIVSLVSFLEDYKYHTKLPAAPQMQYGAQEWVTYVKGVEDKYGIIYVSRSLGAPNIWIQFYEKWDPKEVQKASKEWLNYEKEGFLYLDRLDGYSLGKYRFGSLYYEKNKSIAGILFVGKPEEFPEKIPTLHTVYYPDGKPAILIVDPSSQGFAAR